MQGGHDVNAFLFPAIEPFNTGMLEVSPIHTLYFEECGNPAGKPVVILHGGPGSGCSEDMRRYHDPQQYRIILLDQRGAGRSTPFASLDDNTTWHLVDDLEKLRVHLHVDRWQVFGGSWGSTLGIVYAITHPDRVQELILRGIFLLRKQEIDFTYQHGTNLLYPDRWEAFQNAIPEQERDDFVAAYRKRLTSDVPAHGHGIYTTLQLDAAEKVATNTKATEAFARIENHFLFHKGFLTSDDFLLANASKIRHIPTVIVHGRYDVVCPVQTAWELHKVLPESELHVVQSAGHSGMEPPTVKELVNATNKFKVQ
ncbi:prolyl aminopeptidase [Phytophthora cinnamomi]|uniref:prolyl aminopeptidase n=1 Tax=Phytophthora cinnamomi TaxID=4785 RepID=UPI00355A0D6D|nr:prolyl aminopeptidase [Phytophthora cinnamomi]